MFEYITSRQNPLMVLTVKLLSSAKHRRRNGMYVGEGTKLLNEALRWAPDQIKTVIISEGSPCPELPGNVRTVYVPLRLLEQISELETPEGALFLMELPADENKALVPGTLILDGVQDPGNMGTILRTADALDVPIMITEDCADPYGPKTVRATMGAIFRTPPARITRDSLVHCCHESRIPLISASLSEYAVDIRHADLKHAAVVIGSEGKGVSKQILAASDSSIIIPMHPRCESLNAAVAAAIVLWQMTVL